MSKQVRESIRIYWPGRQLGPDRAITDAKDKANWKAALKLLKRRTYKVGADRVSVSIDWKPLADAITGRARLPEVTLNALIDVSSERATVGDFTSAFFHEVFLCMNLAVPGSCGFNWAEVRRFGQTSAGPVNLLGVSFETAWIRSLDAKWNVVGTVPLQRVWRWYLGLGIGLHQLARSPVEKALFSVYHIAEANYGDPHTIMWIAQALESLYQVPAALSRSLLERRVMAMLPFRSAGTADLRKKLRDFYDVRNSIAHGGAPVIHPLRNDIWDNSMLEHSNLLLDQSDTGFALVVATLQLLAAKSWRGIGFSETFRARKSR